MSQADTDHITSISADDSAINFSDDFYAGSDDSRNNDSDLWGNLDLAMVNMLAGLGVLGGLVGYHATGKYIDSEAVTWLASKLNDDLDLISDSIDPLRPPLRRVEGVN